MRDRFGATDPRAQQLRFHTQTAGSTLAAQQPDNNIVRVAIQAMAAVLGGTQSLHCNGRDEALALPTEESARIALRTQQVIAHETGAANTVDPLAGAWALEARTNEIEGEARATLDGSSRSAARSRRSKRARLSARSRSRPIGRSRRSTTATQVVVGVNRYAATTDRRPGQARPPAHRSRDRTAAGRAREGAAGLERGRGRVERRRSTQSLPLPADRDNLVPPIIAAVEAKATLGEIADTLRGVFGEHKEIDT